MSNSNIDVSVCIPTMEEEDFGRYLGYLKQQTMFKQGKMDIVVADYDPGGKHKTYMSIGPLLDNHIFFVPVLRKGIAHARHRAILADFHLPKFITKVIVNFDADAYFSTNDAIEKLTKPILEGKAVVTCCDNLFDTRNLNQEQLNSIRLINDTLSALNRLQSAELLAPVLEPGLTCSREAYDFVGGFPDVVQYEGAMLGAKLMHSYTPLLKKWIPDIAVVQSPRRALGAAKEGVFRAYGNYLESSYRT